MTGTDSRSQVPGGRTAAVVMGLVVGLTLVVACIELQSGKYLVDRHDWWDDRGPVVPHETFPANCSLCHTPVAWDVLRENFSFDHLAETGVALEGAHATAECLRCHNDRGPVQVFASRGCAGCHEDTHLGQLGNECTTCHTQHDWLPQGQVAEHARTRFPLVGAHAGTACFACHPGAQVGNFTRLPVDCASCHQTDLAQATEPDHMAQGWVTDCQRCHVPTAWQGAGFQHDFFPLTAGHALADCTACHVNDVFAGTPTDCFACHQSDYDGTDDPPHAAAGFSTMCQECHTTAGWDGASINHSFFPLVGGHAISDCTQCHAGGVFVGTPTDCVACHQTDYDNARDPNHAALGFPTGCQKCHSVNTWDGAFFAHAFPIDRGDHGNFDCTQCHTVPGNASVFSCIDCHEHNQRDMDDEHDDVGGYVYASMACYACHPDGDD